MAWASRPTSTPPSTASTALWVPQHSGTPHINTQAHTHKQVHLTPMCTQHTNNNTATILLMHAHYLLIMMNYHMLTYACICIRWYAAVYLKCCGPSSSRAHRLASVCCELSGYWGSSKSPSESTGFISYIHIIDIKLQSIKHSFCLFLPGTGHLCVTLSSLF